MRYKASLKNVKIRGRLILIFETDKNEIIQNFSFKKDAPKDKY